MLYKNLCSIYLATASMMTTLSFGDDYYVSSGANSTACSNLTDTDVCNFYCDQRQWKQPIDCGHSKECNIYCTRNKCAETSIISAQNTGNINLYSPRTANDCYKSATIYTPNNGNAIFTNTGTGNNPFEGIIVNSGTNTQNIIIDCSGVDPIDECKQIQINAETAQFLRITVNGTLGPDAEINCPTNSDYNGFEMAPCIIDASSGGTFDGVTINAVNGIPNDLWIETIPNTQFLSNSTLICANETVSLMNSDDILSTQNGCCDPITNNPTIYPSIYPTQYPTTNPIISYITTHYPTYNPTLLVTDSKDRFNTKEINLGNVNSDGLNRTTEQQIWYLLVGIIALFICLTFAIVMMQFSRTKSHKKGRRNTASAHEITLSKIFQSQTGPSKHKNEVPSGSFYDS